jgi:hypothetical protein
MEWRRASEDADQFLPMLRGWCVGGEAFRQELLQRMDQPGAEHFGPEIRESAQDKAERLVRAELSRLGWTASDLARQRKGAPQKLRIALRLRRETTMTLAWIAQRLCMGTKTHLSHLLYWHSREKKPKRKGHPKWTC